MNKEEFKKELIKLNVSDIDNKLKKLELYLEYLTEYNQHTNLTRIINEDEAYLKHFYDSLTISKVIDLNEFESLIDIGSGAGFPGVVIKIFYPNIHVTLLDSNNKKTKFLTSLVEKLQLDVNVVNERAEDYAKKKLNSYDIVTARAVANLRVLTEISAPFIKEKGFFIAMKGQATSELLDVKTTLKCLDMSIIQIENFNLSKEAGERTLIKIQKNSETKYKSLRSYDQILKKPLK